MKMRGLLKISFTVEAIGLISTQQVELDCFHMFCETVCISCFNHTFVTSYILYSITYEQIERNKKGRFSDRCARRKVKEMDIAISRNLKTWHYCIS